jgi:hypothetical protein
MKRDARTRAWPRLDAAYAFALRLYPRAFRERWAEPMRQAFRDRCREVARGEHGITALLAESCADLARSLTAEHCRSMEETPMKIAAIVLAAVLSASYLGRVALHSADLHFAFASLLMVAPSLLFLLVVARPAWPMRLAALLLNGLMPLLLAVGLVQDAAFLPVMMRTDPFALTMMVGLGFVSPALNLLAMLRMPRHAMPLAA